MSADAESPNFLRRINGNKRCVLGANFVKVVTKKCRSQNPTRRGHHGFTRTQRCGPDERTFERSLIIQLSGRDIMIARIAHNLFVMSAPVRRHIQHKN